MSVKLFASSQPQTAVRHMTNELMLLGLATLILLAFQSSVSDICGAHLPSSVPSSLSTSERMSRTSLPLFYSETYTLHIALAQTFGSSYRKPCQAFSEGIGRYETIIETMYPHVSIYMVALQYRRPRA